jgi:hypothetical protein
LGDKFGYIDKKDREVVPLFYAEANNYHGIFCYKGMAYVKENGKRKNIQIRE